MSSDRGETRTSGLENINVSTIWVFKVYWVCIVRTTIKHDVKRCSVYVRDPISKRLFDPMRTVGVWRPGLKIFVKLDFLISIRFSQLKNLFKSSYWALLIITACSSTTLFSPSSTGECPIIVALGWIIQPAPMVTRPFMIDPSAMIAVGSIFRISTPGRDMAADENDHFWNLVSFWG